MGAERRCGPANGSGGWGHPTVAAAGWAGRASRALAGGGRGGHGGSGFALFPGDSPPVSVRAAQSAAGAQRSLGGGGALLHAPERLVGALDSLPASLPACCCPARPGLVPSAPRGDSMLYRGAALSPAPLSRTDSHAEPGSSKPPGEKPTRPRETCTGLAASPSPRSLLQLGLPQPPSRSPRRPARTPPSAGLALDTARGAGRGWSGPGGRHGPGGAGSGRIPSSAGPQALPPSWQGAGAAAAQEMEDAGP